MNRKLVGILFILFAVFVNSVVCVYAQSDFDRPVVFAEHTKQRISVLQYDAQLNEQLDFADAQLNTDSSTGKSESIYIEAPSKKWQFSVIPYLWLMGINGKTTIKGTTADLNVSFGDIWDNLDFAAEVHIEAWRDRYGFFIDTSYANIAIKKDVQLRLDNTLNTKFTTEFFLGELGGFYRVGTWPLGSGTTSYHKGTKTSITFDVLGGGRYWYLKNTLNLNGPLDELPSKVSDSQSWFDFLLGGA